MKTLKNRANGNLLVEMNTLDLVNLIGLYNQDASVRAVEEVVEGDYKSSLNIFESYNTKIGGTVLALQEILLTGENPTAVYNENDSIYIRLLRLNNEN